MPWTPPKIGTRPIAIIGGGIRGARIACAFVAGGYTVHLHEWSPVPCSDAQEFVEQHALSFAESIPHRPKPSQSQLGTFKTWHGNSQSRKEALKNAWLVIEGSTDIDAVNPTLEAFIFKQLDEDAPADCILATNSPWINSSELLEKVSSARRKLICNVQFHLPKKIRIVELIAVGETPVEILPSLGDVLKACGMIPVTVQKESRGLISQRLLQAVHREALTMLEEGVSDAAQIDRIWENAIKSSRAPCRMMDVIGLRSVASLEDVCCQERGLDRKHIDFLQNQYIKVGKYRSDSPLGSLYPPDSSSENGCCGERITSEVLGNLRTKFSDHGNGILGEENGMTGDCIPEIRQL